MEYGNIEIRRKLIIHQLYTLNVYQWCLFMFIPLHATSISMLKMMIYMTVLTRDSTVYV